MRSNKLLAGILLTLIALTGITTTEAQLKTLRINYIAPSAHYFPLYVMQQKNILAKHGYELELVVSDGPLAVQLLSRGHLDFNSTLSSAYLAQARGILALDVPCVMVDKLDFKLIAGKHIHTIQDLRGKKIGLAATQSFIVYPIRQLLATVGISINDVTLIAEKSYKTRIQLVKNGILDAATTDYSWALLEAGDYPTFELTGFYDHPMTGLGILSQNQHLKKIAYDAGMETMQYMKTHPEETISLLQHWLNIPDMQKARLVYERMLETLTMTCFPRSPEATKNLQSFIHEMTKK